MDENTDDKHAVGRRIAQARREAGYTQTELANLVGVKQRSVQAWEYGRTNPYRRLRRLEKVLGRPRAWILHGDETEEGESGVSRRLDREPPVLLAPARSVPVDEEWVSALLPTTERTLIIERLASLDARVERLEMRVERLTDTVARFREPDAPGPADIPPKVGEDSAGLGSA